MSFPQRALQPPSPWRPALAKVIIYTLLSFWTVVCLFPLYWVATISIKSGEDIDRPATYLPFVDFTPSLHAWRFILSDPYENLVARFANSLVVATASTLLTLMIGGLAIYGLTRFRAALRWPSLASACLAVGLAEGVALVPPIELKLLFATGTILLLALAFVLRRWGPTMNSFTAMTFMLATRILPPVVIVLPLYMMLQATGTRDTLGALIFVYAAVNLPVAVWLLQPVLGRMATDQEEAALLDGATHLSIVFSILLPMVRAGVVAAGLIIFLLCWNEYLFAAYLTAENALTLPPWMVGQVSLREAATGGGPEEWAHMSAAILVMVFPALIFAAIAQRLLGRTLISRP
jgi:multiple sugar transport system permease protein